jgi:HK97 family phage major capsid protein
VTDPVFGSVRVPVYTAMLSMPVTQDLIEDSAVALLPWIESRFSETIELLKDNMILNGSGVGQPAGILMNPGGTGQPSTVNVGASGAVTADGIISVGWSLPEQYDEQARWIFNKTVTGQAIAKLKDAENRYIWSMGTQDGGLSPSIQNRELLGYPVNYSGFMPDPANNAYPVIFGDLRGYYLVNRVGFSIKVLNELYAETNQVLLLGRVRFGGVVAEEFRLKIGKTPA